MVLQRRVKITRMFLNRIRTEITYHGKQVNLAACLPPWKMSFSLLKSSFNVHTGFYEQRTGMSVFLQVWDFFPCCQWLACLQLFFSDLTVLDQYTFKQCYSTKPGLGKQRTSYQNFTAMVLEKVIKFIVVYSSFQNSSNLREG